MLLEEIDDPPRSADQHVDASLQLAALPVVIHAAEGEAQREAGVLAEDFRVAMDLHRQLAGRSQDQRARRADRSFRPGGLAQQPRVQCDQEGGGLAGAGLGLAGDVESGQRARQRLGLDRRAALETSVGNAAGHGLGQVQGGKGKVGELLFSHRNSSVTIGLWSLSLENYPPTRYKSA